jgi:hypothetical protein
MRSDVIPSRRKPPWRRRAFSTPSSVAAWYPFGIAFAVLTSGLLLRSTRVELPDEHFSYLFVRLLQTLDVDLGHLQQRLHDSIRPRGVIVLQHLA